MKFGRAERERRHEEQARTWLRSVVRSGLYDPGRLERELREVISADLPHLDPNRAGEWIAEATAEWERDALAWPVPCEYDRLRSVFARLDREGLPVLQGCEDHWAAQETLDQLADDIDGLVWFTPLDVWHAVDEPMLEVNVWSRDGINQHEGSPLVERVIAACSAEGFEAHFDEGRLEIAARWQRRPEGSPAST